MGAERRALSAAAVSHCWRSTDGTRSTPTPPSRVRALRAGELFTLRGRESEVFPGDGGLASVDMTFPVFGGVGRRPPPPSLQQPHTGLKNFGTSALTHLLLRLKKRHHLIFPLRSFLSVSDGSCCSPWSASSWSLASSKHCAQPGASSPAAPFPGLPGAEDYFMCLTHDAPVYTSRYRVCIFCSGMTLCTQPRHNPDCFPWKGALV